MLVRKMSSREARANFSDLLGSVFYTNQPVIVEKKGNPVAVVISLEEFERYRQEEKEDWDIIDQIRVRNKDKNPEEVYKEITAVVEEVRQEMYEKKKGSSKRNS